ncbi:MAG: DUF4190 domain-containing protein [Coprococcus sp.]|nr:DUF4190 domain-containing protein [Coprococcus sp.]
MEQQNNYFNQQQGSSQQMYQQQSYPYSPQGSAGLGIASMVLGIVALVFSCCLYYVSLPCAIVGLILGGVSLSKKKPGKGMAVAGLVCSIVSLVPTIIIISAGASLWAEIQSMMLICL